MPPVVLVGEGRTLVGAWNAPNGPGQRVADLSARPTCLALNERFDLVGPSTSRGDLVFPVPTEPTRLPPSRYSIIPSAAPNDHRARCCPLSLRPGTYPISRLPDTANGLTIATDSVLQCDPVQYPCLLSTCCWCRKVRAERVVAYAVTRGGPNGDSRGSHLFFVRFSGATPG